MAAHLTQVNKPTVPEQSSLFRKQGINKWQIQQLTNLIFPALIVRSTFKFPKLGIQESEIIGQDVQVNEMYTPLMALKQL
jgi:hypothetical protein